jgi:hypothetical protein
MDRILDKGLAVFPKLVTLDVAAAVAFYNKLNKTLALFLLPLMHFDAVNLHMGFEGLCPPGLRLPQYAENPGVMTEVIPCLLPTFESQVASLVMVVYAESNNGYDLLWGVIELLVPGSTLLCRPVLLYGWERIFLAFASHMSSIFAFR